MVGPAYVRVRILGVFGTTDQSWSFGLNFAPSDSTFIPGGHLTQAQLAAVSSGVRALNSNTVVGADLLSIFSTLVRIQAVRASMVGLDGKEEAIALTTLSTPQQGQGTPSMPTEVALAASLRTGLPGRSGRGRIYLPAQGCSVDTSGRLGQNTAAIATAVAGLCSGIAGVVAGAANIPSIRAVVVSTAKEDTTPITSVQVGDVLDVQRRRRDQYREVYGVAAVAQ